MGDFNKKESESLDFTGLKIPRDYNSDMEDYIRTKLIESLFKFRFDR